MQTPEPVTNNFANQSAWKSLKTFICKAIEIARKTVNQILHVSTYEQYTIY